MIECIDFKPEHLIGIEKDDPDANVFLFIGDMDKKAEQYAKSGPAITLLDGTNILAIGGVIKFWEGVGEAWMMVSPEGRKNWLSIYRYMSAFVKVCFTKYRFHRIQANVLDTHPTAHRCIMKLGFVPEGMMLHYGPNKENFVRYMRIE